MNIFALNIYLRLSLNSLNPNYYEIHVYEIHVYFLFEINESNVDSFQACVGEVYGDREIRWLFGS